MLGWCWRLRDPSRTHARSGGAGGSGAFGVSPTFISIRQSRRGSPRGWTGQSSSLLDQAHLFPLSFHFWSRRTLQSHLPLSPHVSVTSVDMRKAGHPSRHQLRCLVTLSGDNGEPHTVESHNFSSQACGLPLPDPFSFLEVMWIKGLEETRGGAWGGQRAEQCLCGQTPPPSPHQARKWNPE